MEVKCKGRGNSAQPFREPETSISHLLHQRLTALELAILHPNGEQGFGKAAGDYTLVKQFPLQADLVKEDRVGNIFQNGNFSPPF